MTFQTWTMKEIAHGVYEDLPWLLPSIGDSERLAVFPHQAVPYRAFARLPGKSRIFFDAHGFKALGHLHRITMGASGGDDRAACDGIPSGVSPLYLTFGHLVPRG